MRPVYTLTPLRKNDRRKCKFCSEKALFVSTTRRKHFPLFGARCAYHGMTWAFKKEAKVWSSWAERERNRAKARSGIGEAK